MNDLNNKARIAAIAKFKDLAWARMPNNFADLNTEQSLIMVLCNHIEELLEMLEAYNT